MTICDFAPRISAPPDRETAAHPLRLRFHAATQTVCEWVFSGGGSSHDKTRAVTTDSQGNVFLASECVGDASFGDQQHRTSGGMDMCLVKLNAAGKPRWVSAIGGSKTDRAYGVITDAAGNALCCQMEASKVSDELQTGHLDRKISLIKHSTMMVWRPRPCFFTLS
ncbi:MAG: hypothetical protein JNN17_11830 [Verrucomicrobiaceae bacterium]|nr:hypothetical protein [Verrucomicrobiaceae bacterium]